VGTTIDVEAQGTFSTWPIQVWIGRPGLDVRPQEKKGELTVTVAADATPGVYWLRLYDAEGASPLVPFVVGSLPEVREQEPNDSPTKPQELPSASVVVNGWLDRRGDVDTFAVRLDQGQTLVADIEAQRVLASPLDAVVEIVSSTGFVLARNDDDQGIDPRIVFIAPQTGIYLVRTFGFPAAPDSSIALAGGDAFLYRLIVTVGGFLDYTLPLAVASPTQQVQPAGWNLPAEAQNLTPVALPEPNRVAIVHPRLGNMMVLPVTSHASILAREPSEAGNPQRIELPSTITGRLEKPRDRDTFRFTAHKNETIDFGIESRTLGYPLDPVLEIFDGQGKSLVRVDDSADGRDAQLAFAVPADGEYDLVVTDLHRQGGPRFVYRLTAVLARPDYALSLGGDAFLVQVGQKLELPVAVERLQGFAESINLHAEGMPPGASVEPAVSTAEGDSAKAVKLVITAGASPFAGPIRISGVSASGAADAHVALATIPGRSHKTSAVWLTVAGGEKK
jgi:hypothetical protein